MSDLALEILIWERKVVLQEVCSWKLEDGDEVQVCLLGQQMEGIQ